MRPVATAHAEPVSAGSTDTPRSAATARPFAFLRRPPDVRRRRARARSRSTPPIPTARRPALMLAPGDFVGAARRAPATGVVWAVREAAATISNRSPRGATGRRSDSRCATSSTGWRAGRWPRAAWCCAWRRAAHEGAEPPAAIRPRRHRQAAGAHDRGARPGARRGRRRRGAARPGRRSPSGRMLDRRRSTASSRTARSTLVALPPERIAPTSTRTSPADPQRRPARRGRGRLGARRAPAPSRRPCSKASPVRARPKSISRRSPRPCGSGGRRWCSCPRSRSPPSFSTASRRASARGRPSGIPD